jgi:hypothetical protein
VDIKRRFGAAVAAAALLLPSIAVAQPDAKAAAQALFDDAVHDLEAKAYDRACPKLEEVVRLQPGKVGAMMALASCYEADGKLAAAWGRYRAAADVAGRSADPRQAEAEKKAAAIAPKLGKLTISVSPANASVMGFKLTADGLELGAALWGVPFPVDTGAHRVAATAPGRRAWSQEVVVANGGDARGLQVPELEADAPVAAPAPPLAPVAPVDAGALADEARRRKDEQAARDAGANAPTQEAPRPRRWTVAAIRKTAGVTLMAGGGGLAAVGCVFLGLGAAENGSIRGGGFATGADITSAAKTGATYNVLAGVLLGFGVAAAGVGLPLYVSGASARPPLAVVPSPHGLEVTF